MKPILSVNYCAKWYAFALSTKISDTSGKTITVVHFSELEDYCGNNVPYVDHVPNPVVVQRMCDAKGWDIDDLSFELMVGRWALEVKGEYNDL
jgi:hypothetical protein